VVGSLKSVVEANDVGVADVFDDEYLLGYHFFLLFGNSLVFDHLDGVTLEFSLLATFKDLTRRPRAYLLDQFVVAHFFEFTHL
jgi:hypothetical protein